MEECDCKDWEENMPQLNTILIMATLRNDSGYKGKFFKYCPWCGKIDQGTKKESDE